jgi:type IV pilus assembly protein PilA
LRLLGRSSCPALAPRLNSAKRGPNTKAMSTAPPTRTTSVKPEERQPNKPAPKMGVAWGRTPREIRAALVGLVIALVGVIGYVAGHGGSSGTSRTVTVAARQAPSAVDELVLRHNRDQDASAESDARNLVSHVESCFADRQDYRRCQTVSDLGRTGLNIAQAPKVSGMRPPASPGPGEVAVVKAGSDTYEIDAVSESGNRFGLLRTEDGEIKRTCASEVTGGCHAGSW